MLPLVVMLLLAGADAGHPPPPDVRALVDRGLAVQLGGSPTDKAELVAALRDAQEFASPAERELLGRLVRLVDLDPTSAAAFQGLVSIVRDAVKVSRGRPDDEVRLLSTFISLAATARNFGLDPAPVLREARVLVQDFIKRTPHEGRAYGLYATLLQQADARPQDVLAVLKRCATLSPQSSCRAQHAQVLASFERPRCAGAALLQPLTVTGAQADVPPSPGRALTVRGQVLALEDRPFLGPADVHEVSLDEQGQLALTLTAAGAATMERESQRLMSTPSGWLVLRRGADVLMAARLMERLPGPLVTVPRGPEAPAYRLETLCRTIEHPRVDRALRLE